MNFEEFWQAYPRRVGKKKAEIAFRKVKPSNHQAILSAIKAHLHTDQWQRDGGVFIPYPATWLNGERWNDELKCDLRNPIVNPKPVLIVDKVDKEPMNIGHPPPEFRAKLDELLKSKVVR